ncbi:hypothetical protein DOY81_014727, partial [Sarcophaga bullata]
MRLIAKDDFATKIRDSRPLLHSPFSELSPLFMAVHDDFAKQMAA